MTPIRSGLGAYLRCVGEWTDSASVMLTFSWPRGTIYLFNHEKKNQIRAFSNLRIAIFCTYKVFRQNCRGVEEMTLRKCSPAGDICQSNFHEIATAREKPKTRTTKLLLESIIIHSCWIIPSGFRLSQRTKACSKTDGAWLSSVRKNLVACPRRRTHGRLLLGWTVLLSHPLMERKQLHTQSKGQGSRHAVQFKEPLLRCVS